MVNVKRPRKTSFWQSWLIPWQELDWFLILLALGLTGFGGIMIRSTELNFGWTDWWQHWLMGGISLILTLWIARLRYEHLLRWQWWIYGVTCVSLIAVRFIGTSALGAQRWINVLGFHVQPSEFAKIGAIIVLAANLSVTSASSLAAVFRTLVIIALPWVLVFIQPDLGTSLVFGAITFVMLYWADAHWGWLVLMLSPVISAILFSISLPVWFLWLLVITIIAYVSLPEWRISPLIGLVVNLLCGGLGNWFWMNLLKDYQRDRLVLFLDPSKDPLGGGYHLIQSRIAIGSGQFWGQGLYQGSQTQLNFIPEQHTDFIFSAIGEELGFVGSSILIFVYWLLCLRLVMIAQNAKDNFGSLLAIGVLGMIVFQVLINIGMNIGLAPVTGIPLPWISYGRSAILTNFIAIGLVESVFYYRHRPKFSEF